MSLRTKAVLVSMLPLVVIFLIAIPEAILQGQAIRTTVLAQRAAIIASAAGAIMGERVRSLLAARNLLDGRTHDLHEYDVADSRFQESAVRLASVVGVAPPAGVPARRGDIGGRTRHTGPGAIEEDE